MIHLSHLIQMLRNIDVNLDELKKELADMKHTAKKETRTVVTSWAGMFDLIVHPSGYFQIVPLSSFKLYKISDKSENHYEEVI